MSLRPATLVVVLGTGTEIGKTWVSCRLLAGLRASGLAVAARKPVQSFDAPTTLPHVGVDSDIVARQWTDAELLGAASGEAPTVVCPAHRWYRLAQAPPMAAGALGQPEIRLADLVAETVWPEGVHVGLVETAGGPRSPMAHDGDGVDLTRLLDPDLALLVADAGLGTINAVRLCVAAIAPLPVVVLLNRFDPADALHAANLRWLIDVDHLDVVTTTDALVARLRSF